MAEDEEVFDIEDAPLDNPSEEDQGDVGVIDVEEPRKPKKGKRR